MFTGPPEMSAGLNAHFDDPDAEMPDEVSNVAGARVVKLHYHGSYDILLTKLGQELIDDCCTLEKICQELDERLGMLKTPAGSKTAKDCLAAICDLQNLPNFDQKQLQKKLNLQNFKDKSLTPSWANGAVVICTPLDACEIQQILQGECLKKGDVVVSSELKDFVQSLIEAKTEDPGPKKDYRKQAPKMKTPPEELHSPSVSFVTSLLQRRHNFGRSYSEPPKTLNLADGSSRGTHTTGSRPRSDPARGRDYGPVRKQFHLKHAPSNGALGDENCDVADGVEVDNACSTAMSISSTIADGLEREVWDCVLEFRRRTTVPEIDTREEFAKYVAKASENVEPALL